MLAQKQGAVKKKNNDFSILIDLKKIIVFLIG
jgi:hypothetical protein